MRILSAQTSYFSLPQRNAGTFKQRRTCSHAPRDECRYYRGERYVETDMDTGSSAAAASLCGRCRGLSRKINVELGIVLQVCFSMVRVLTACQSPPPPPSTQYCEVLIIPVHLYRRTQILKTCVPVPPVSSPARRTFVCFD